MPPVLVVVEIIMEPVVGRDDFANANDFCLPLLLAKFATNFSRTPSDNLFR